jgi:hypothetical protein
MAKPISQFFTELGFPLRNIRWSWGAKNAEGTALLLRAWDDEYSLKNKTVTVLRPAERYEASDSFGLDERIVQLTELWAGALTAYAVIATAKDGTIHPREIKGYREDVVFGVKRLSLRDDGAIVAEVSELVPVNTLQQHIAAHRIEAASGAFPVGDAQRSGLSTDGYKQKIPAIRGWLLDKCRAKTTVTYSDVMDRFGLTFFPLVGAMNRLGHACRDAGEPIITSLIVDKNTGRCSQGIFDEFHIDDDALERQRCFAYWGGVLDQHATAISAPPVASTSADYPPDDLEQRAARFAQIAVRTQQAAFRLRVFRAHHGRCAISGCAIPEALEAAHLLGREWRQGHNEASDGILLRRDLHTLYDCGLLRISEAGIVELDERAYGHYSDLAGLPVIGSAESHQPI